VESGLNDGLALPIVIALLADVSHESTDAARLATDLLFGVVLGVIVPYAAIRIEQSRFFSAAAKYEPLYPVAIGLLLFSLASVIHANLFLAAFTAGITVSSFSERFRTSFHRLGELISELLKLLAVLLFGTLISPSFLGEISVAGYIFAVITVAVARPVALVVSFLGSTIASGWPQLGLDRRGLRRWSTRFYWSNLEHLGVMRCSIS
jgi:sodium/hydrogen antiporter